METALDNRPGRAGYALMASNPTAAAFNLDHDTAASIAIVIIMTIPLHSACAWVLVVLYTVSIKCRSHTHTHTHVHVSNSLSTYTDLQLGIHMQAPIVIIRDYYIIQEESCKT